MNGKSGNLNNICSQLYPKGAKVPATEILCIFDADQVSALCHVAIRPMNVSAADGNGIVKSCLGFLACQLHKRATCITTDLQSVNAISASVGCQQGVLLEDSAVL
jgi:hypothetical protein